MSSTTSFHVHKLGRLVIYSLLLLLDLSTFIPTEELERCCHGHVIIIIEACPPSVTFACFPFLVTPHELPTELLRVVSLWQGIC